MASDAKRPRDTLPQGRLPGCFQVRLAAAHSRVPCFLQESRDRGAERQGIPQRHQPTLEGVEPTDPFKAGKVDRMLQDFEMPSDISLTT